MLLYESHHSNKLSITNRAAALSFASFSAEQLSSQIGGGSGGGAVDRNIKCCNLFAVLLFCFVLFCFVWFCFVFYVSFLLRSCMGNY